MSCFFFKQKTAYEMRISDWSSDVCSSNLPCRERQCRVAVLLQKVERKPGSERGDLLAPLQSAILPLRCDGVQPPVRRDCVLRRTEGPGAIRLDGAVPSAGGSPLFRQRGPCSRRGLLRPHFPDTVHDVSRHKQALINST